MKELELAKHKQLVTTITPADKTIVKLHEIRFTGSAWLSLYVGDAIIGLRRYEALFQKKKHAIESKHTQKRNLHDETIQQSAVGCFFCHTHDDVRITAAIKPGKPDKKSPVYVTMTYLNGFQLTVAQHAN